MARVQRNRAVGVALGAPLRPRNKREEARADLVQLFLRSGRQTRPSSSDGLVIQNKGHEGRCQHGENNHTKNAKSDDRKAFFPPAKPKKKMHEVNLKSNTVVLNRE
jgi:hypothetical protein